ncbi:MAG: septal ring lytic transglycosylase RlpA family protein [Proteobacteria bacterium]|nr:septal ring lytic transglycosylase RlpA family protein [Pseudomonadota bacterium]
MNKAFFALTAFSALAAWSGAAEAHRAPIEYAADRPATAPSNELAGGDSRSYGYGAASSSQADGAVLDLRRTNDAASAPLPVQDAPMQQPGMQGQGRPEWLENERVGPPYQANGRWYVPAAEPGYEATGTASWYGPNFHGGRTASGEIYDQEAITAAHPTLPIPSLVQVTNLENGREVIVRVNDRGPFVGDRILDLSHGAAQVLGVERNGTARVHIRYLGPAPRHYGDPAASMQASAPPPQPQSASADAEGPASLLPPPAHDQGPASSPSVQQVGYAPAAPMPLAAASGSYFVQVGAFSDVTNARRAQSALDSVGQVAVDVRRDAAGAELFRVRVGPFPNRGAAEAARRSVVSLGYPESTIVAP